MTGRADASGDRAVAAGGNIEQVITGDFSTQVGHGVLLPAESLSVPASGLVHLPERTALFVGRAGELARLDAGAPSGVQVLCGLGGIGKSTLAAHWAAGRIDDHHPVWWITAETVGELDAGLAALARAMQPAYVGILPEDALRERALQWLAAHDHWLLVLDNVSDPADVKPLLARAARGRVLITSRRATGWQDLAETIAVPELDPEESAALFARVCPGDGVAEVCAELGHLPLALRQAAAYCSEAGISPRAYLDLLARYPAETYALTAEGGETGRTVARVWQVTLDRLEDTPLAGRILGVLAWWASEGIPRRLLEPLGSPLEVTEAIRRLRAHSMIALDGESLSVHRVVQAVVRGGRGAGGGGGTAGGGGAPAAASGRGAREPGGVEGDRGPGRGPRPAYGAGPGQRGVGQTLRMGRPAVRDGGGRTRRVPRRPRHARLRASVRAGGRTGPARDAHRDGGVSGRSLSGVVRASPRAPRRCVRP
ncbi:hypothetical protein [Streptomyces tanashiensis]|uniref:hypothetical protein n=1 Tax=Streptomyces tanashiensis TaxID=67367 RepID=UPI00343FDFC7